MNFFKKIFFMSAKQEPKVEKKPQQQLKKDEQQDDIPLEVLSELFEKSAKYIGSSSKSISDQNKLIIYGLYKQATVGDCNTPKPSALDFIGKSKWNAWNNNQGISKSSAMKMYISKAVQIDPEIEKKMQNSLEGNQQGKSEDLVIKKPQVAVQSSIGLRKVEQQDYSSAYSHPYFKSIEKNLPIEGITKEQLMQVNNNPKCYPLHFAIDKQRVDLVKQFLEVLTVEEIESLKDEDGTSVEEYAQLIENQEIIDLVRLKLHGSS